MGSFQSKLSSSSFETPDTSPSHTTPSTPSKPPPPLPHFLALDVQTTTEDKPQIVSIAADLYVLDGTSFRRLAGMEAVVKPRRGYAVLRHMQDVRVHGVTAETIADHGVDTEQAVGRLCDIVATASSGVVVLAHSAEGMLSNFLAAVKADDALHPYWGELEGLCHDVDDTLLLATREIPGLRNHQLEYTLAACGLSLPPNRALSVAKLYCYFQGFSIVNEAAEPDSP